MLQDALLCYNMHFNSLCACVGVLDFQPQVRQLKGKKSYTEPNVDPTQMIKIQMRAKNTECCESLFWSDWTSVLGNIPFTTKGTRAFELLIREISPLDRTGHDINYYGNDSSPASLYLIIK